MASPILSPRTPTMNAVELEVLVQHYYKRVPMEGASPAITGAAQTLYSLDLLYDPGVVEGPVYEITERGQAYIEHLLRVRLPELISNWEIPK